jgi:sulfopyruvate decarboxylase subunit beta
MVQLSLVDCLHALRESRTDEVVIAAMGAAREWMTLSSHPLDFIFVPSSMGQATSLGLGMALARPERRVLVLNGDGSMLMNLGSLVTITAQSPANLSLVVLDNGVYEVTGSQQTPGTSPARADGRDIDFGAIASACGFRSVIRPDSLAAWRSHLPALLRAPGPHFVHLPVVPMYDRPCGPKSPGAGRERTRRFAAALLEY